MLDIFWNYMCSWNDNYARGCKKEMLNSCVRVFCIEWWIEQFSFFRYEEGPFRHAFNQLDVKYFNDMTCLRIENNNFCCNYNKYHVQIQTKKLLIHWNLQQLCDNIGLKLTLDYFTFSQPPLAVTSQYNR